MTSYKHVFALHFTMQSESTCEDVDNYPSEQEFLQALITTINELRHGGSISAACDLLETREVKR